METPPKTYPVSILPLLRQISTSPASVTPESITSAITSITSRQVSPLQTGVLLTALHYTTLDTSPPIIAASARALRASGIPLHDLPVPSPSPLPGLGTYRGGAVDIVGTGGDGHDTYNVSTTAAVVAAGAGLCVAKHGSKASTSASGSADLLEALGARILSVDAETVSRALQSTEEDDVTGRFAFVYAPLFHPAMKSVAEVRREIGCRTIFNVLGPLISPVDYSPPDSNSGYEARLLGVGKMGLGPVYADTLRLLGVKSAMVVCGEEQLDEVSIAGFTSVWRLRPATPAEQSEAEQRDPPQAAAHGGDGSGYSHGVVVETFKICPEKTFGISRHPLSLVAGGKSPGENAVIFKEILEGKRGRGDPVWDFVVVNAATLVVAAGAVEGEERVEEGVVTGARWRDAVERVERGLREGKVEKAWGRFVGVSQEAERVQAERRG